MRLKLQTDVFHLLGHTWGHLSSLVWVFLKRKTGYTEEFNSQALEILAILGGLEKSDRLFFQESYSHFLLTLREGGSRGVKVRS